MAASATDKLFWNQMKYLQSVNCKLLCVYDENALHAELEKKYYDLLLIVVGSSIHEYEKEPIAQIKERSSVPLVVAGKELDIQKRLAVAKADLYLLLPDDEIVLAEIVENSSFV